MYNKTLEPKDPLTWISVWFDSHPYNSFQQGLHFRELLNILIVMLIFLETCNINAYL